MSLSDLVQISSGSWVNPKEIKRIYTCKSFTDGEPDSTYVVCVDMNPVMFGASSDHYIHSDWPIARIHAALGLVDADALDAHLDGAS